MDLFRLNQICLKYAVEKNIAYEIYGTHKTYAYFAPVTMSADKETWLKRKRNACLRFEISTKDLYEKNNGDEKAFLNKYALRACEYTLTLGAVPIFNQDKMMIGVLSITGLKPEEDHHIAQNILKEFERLQ